MDLELSGSEAGLKMNWFLSNPARTPLIRLRWAGAERLTIDEGGNLLVHHALGTLTDPAPFAYQETCGKKVPVSCAYRLDDEFEFGFTLTGAYDPNLPLVIDPILQYATYLGGNGNDYVYGIAVDSEGCAYVTGESTSFTFPTTPGAFQETYGGFGDAFITKFAADGGSLVYSTYLGGSGSDEGHGIVVDSTGCAYVVGETNSADFPVTPGAVQSALGGNYDAFITKLAADGGSLVYSTYLGGSGWEGGEGIAVDASGCVYVAGQTDSTNFPATTGAFQTIYADGFYDAFVTKLAADGGSLVYSTYLGGSTRDESRGIAVDVQGFAYVVGYTDSANFPVTPGAFQATYAGGGRDAFVTRLAADGGSLVYSTYLGGSGSDEGHGIAVDSAGCAYVAGRTASADFPTTPGAFQETYGGSGDAFVAKLSPAGNSLIASTYLGGSSSEIGYGITLDAQSHAYVTGMTASSDFPTTPQVLPSSYSGEGDAFISIFSAALSNLIVSYYLGGSGLDEGEGIALGPDGAVYSTGQTDSTDFPVTPGAFQTVNAGFYDAYITKTAFAFYRRASLTIQGMV